MSDCILITQRPMGHCLCRNTVIQKDTFIICNLKKTQIICRNPEHTIPDAFNRHQSIETICIFRFDNLLRSIQICQYRLCKPLFKIKSIIFHLWDVRILWVWLHLFTSWLPFRHDFWVTQNTNFNAKSNFSSKQTF